MAFSDNILIKSPQELRFGSGGLSTDVTVTQTADNEVTVTGSLKGTTTVTTVSGDIQTTANGAQIIRSSISELMTLSTLGATTDSSANLLPANSFIEGVVARVTTTITTATDWKLGDGTTAGRFTAANSTLTAGTTDVGQVHLNGNISTTATGPTQAAAAKLRITTTGTPGAGAVRVTVFYRQLVPPTS